MCRLIIRDETGHVAFHRDRLANSARASKAAYGLLWEICFRVLGIAAATMLWVKHAPGVIAVSGRTSEFYQEIWFELSRFIWRLRRKAIKEEPQLAGP